MANACDYLTGLYYSDLIEKCFLLVNIIHAMNCERKQVFALNFYH